MNELTKDQAEKVKQAIEEMFEAIPKSRRMEYLVYLNEAMLFLEAFIREKSKQTKGKGE